MMTNDELKKKILEIFEKAIGDWYEKDDGLFAEGYTPEEGDNRLKAFMADALIAAGIGDVKEAEMERKAYEVAASQYRIEFETQKYWREVAEHRAEVAERALKNACEDVKETVSFLIELSERVDGLRVEGYLPEESKPKAYINRAEKELAEETDGKKEV